MATVQFLMGGLALLLSKSAFWLFPIKFTSIQGRINILIIPDP